MLETIYAITNFLLNNYLLLVILSLYPFVWIFSYYRAAIFEHKCDVEGRIVETFTEAMKGTSLVYLIYLTVLITALETSFTNTGVALETVMLTKFILGIMIYPLSHGVVPENVRSVRILFMIYIWLPYSGQILFCQIRPLALIVAPLLIVADIACDFSKD